MNIRPKTYTILTYLTMLGFGGIGAVILIDLFFVHQEQEMIGIAFCAVLGLVTWRFYGLQKNINQLIATIQQRDVGPMRIVLQLLCVMTVICGLIARAGVYGVVHRVRGEGYAIFG